jgi:DNA-binding GntR family transcriptional regulator
LYADWLSIPMSASPTTLADEIYEALREQIVRGRLLPGERINERTIARERGASRTPVRESLRRLEQTNLVRRDGRAGYVVRRFDLTEMDQLYDVRLALELLAIRTLGEHATPERLAEVREVWRRFPASGDPSEALAADEAFHEALAEQSGNAVLLQFLKDINERIHVIRRIDFTAPDRWATTQLEHDRILERLEAGHIDEATDLLRQNIESSKEKIAELATEGLAQIYLRQSERS